jgi:hypothetical protein
VNASHDEDVRGPNICCGETNEHIVDTLATDIFPVSAQFQFK